MLKDNAIPTLFDHNRDKQLIKRTSTLARNEIVQKKHWCEEGFEASLRTLNTKLIVKKSRRSQKPEILRHKQTSFIN